MSYEVTLFGKDKKDEFKVWNITAKPDVDYADVGRLTIIHGKEGGKLQTKVELISVGKQGRTAVEQAVFEAKARVKKQLDKGYRETKEELEELPLLAMLAKDYNKEGHRIQFPCYGSVKYDGVRCLAKLVDGKVVLESRTGQPYSVPSVEEDLTALMTELNIPVLDGELYYHGAALQDITSAVKRTDTQKEIDKAYRKLQKLEQESEEYLEARDEYEHALDIQDIRSNLQFIVFDVPNDKPFVERLDDLALVFKHSVLYPYIGVCHYEWLKDEAALFAFHAESVDNGYEGAMLRNLCGMYESGKRSADLQKYKTFLEQEFKIVRYKFDKDGGIIYTCLNDLNDREFDMVMGTLAERKANALIADHFVDNEHWATVQFQARFKKTLLPQFPTGKLIRQGKSIGGVFVPSE